MNSRILTLCPAPTLDYLLSAPQVQPGRKNRVDRTQASAGGGGINVARMLHLTLKTDAHPIAILGGEAGALIRGKLREEGLGLIPVHCSTPSRICPTILDASTGLEYRFVPNMPDIPPESWRAAIKAMDLPVRVDWVVLSGRLPQNLPETATSDVMRDCHARGRLFALDTSGEQLRNAVADSERRQDPIDLLKMSTSELESVVGKVEGRAGAMRAAAGLVERGACTLLAVTMGGDGAILASQKGILEIGAAPVESRSAVGAGDAFMAGMIHALTRFPGELETALRWASACGALVAERGHTSGLSLEDVYTMQLRVPDAYAADLTV